jgi:hypothetical protein
MTVAKVMELKANESTAEIEAGDGTIDIHLPLTLKGWNLTEMITDYGPRPVVVTSADGDHFIGEVTEADEARYVLTVELS